jgi:hypothetical protein
VSHDPHPASMHSTVLAVLHEAARTLSSSWHIDSDGRVRQTWPAPEREPRIQRCSACRAEGHNIARCPEVGDGLTMAERVRRIVDARERSR